MSHRAVLSDKDITCAVCFLVVLQWCGPIQQDGSNHTLQFLDVPKASRPNPANGSVYGCRCNAPADASAAAAASAARLPGPTASGYAWSSWAPGRAWRCPVAWLAASLRSCGPAAAASSASLLSWWRRCAQTLPCDHKRPYKCSAGWHQEADYPRQHDEALPVHVRRV